MKRDLDSIKSRAKQQSATLQALRESVKYKRVIGLLSSLDLLIAMEPIPKIVNKIELRDALEIGRKIEPRVLEVLPAALLFSPKSFLHVEEAPSRLLDVVSALERGETGPEFEGIPFKKMYEVANRPVRDGRRKRVSERRIPKTFRFARETLESIQERSLALGIDHTRYLESLVKNDLRFS